MSFKYSYNLGSRSLYLLDSFSEGALCGCLTSSFGCCSVDCLLGRGTSEAGGAETDETLTEDDRDRGRSSLPNILRRKPPCFFGSGIQDGESTLVHDRVSEEVPKSSLVWDVVPSTVRDLRRGSRSWLLATISVSGAETEGNALLLLEVARDGDFIGDNVEPVGASRRNQSYSPASSVLLTT
ncbi:hypothetical protein OGATHE_004299 [Ogataea polymorpha]|uniref:Uncharacterized protein n=1 Tax=Ogataea polymorpha TaxID=460523 RepID=A0A9P8NYU8_9ASCO|nr:hypothetical protein OGATHE_004299 [Ogataea polymorpha]